MTKSIPSLSKIWLKILNFNSILFPALQEQLGVLSSKEEKLMRILELINYRIADKTHQAFIEEYLSEPLFFYNSTDSTAIDVWEKTLKKEKVPKVKKKRGHKRKDDITPVVPKELSMCNQQLAMTVIDVATHLMFGVLALCIYQSIKLLTWYSEKKCFTPVNTLAHLENGEKEVFRTLLNKIIVSG